MMTLAGLLFVAIFMGSVYWWAFPRTPEPKRPTGAALQDRIAELEEDLGMREPADIMTRLNRATTRSQLDAIYMECLAPAWSHVRDPLGRFDNNGNRIPNRAPAISTEVIRW